MLCDSCHYYQSQKPSNNCEFCARLGFPEEVLCCLARNGCKNGNLTECGAYKPRLALATSKQHNSISRENRKNDDSGVTDKEKWFRAYSKQQLQLNPDEIHFKLQFHVCLISQKRNSIFLNPSKYLEGIQDTVYQVSNNFEKTQIEVLWLCSDHIHLYIDTTPDYSVDEIANKLIKISEKEIQSNYPTLVHKYSSIWEAGYFAETIR